MPGVMYGPLHYRSLEMSKTVALQVTRGNYDKAMVLPSSAKCDLNWWVDNVETAYNVVSNGESDLTMTTDASKTGWGCTLQDLPTGGQWTPEEASGHINFLEIKAVLLGLQSFGDKVADRHVKVLIDNTTAVSCLNQMGTAYSMGVWITTAHNPGVANIVADQESRKTSSDLEWALDLKIYQ
ncbi:Pre-mRNA-splicing factor cwc-26 [Paramuricea clavata]|uniref:Pre-mRNA-splicing factor cwc-26 n=1 Tax=Paramuricea clavata TaxID=317549 RepID=A0A6S7KBI4_PARCT|nr:Pre-mRNA-splicing factor cwc-26 [Paramuricea clavata]